MSAKIYLSRHNGTTESAVKSRKDRHAANIAGKVENPKELLIPGHTLNLVEINAGDGGELH